MNNTEFFNESGKSFEKETKNELNIELITKKLNSIGFKHITTRIKIYNNKEEYLFLDKTNIQIILSEVD